MIAIPKIRVGDKLEMKKSHPCGCKVFDVLRIGSDVRISAIRRLGYHLEVEES